MTAIKVLFVCAGNICRSPMAEAVFQHMVVEAGLGDAILVDSAGTGGWHVGESAHSGTLETLQRRGISYNGRSRRVQPTDAREFDYVLAMDRENLNALKHFYGIDQPHVRLFLADAAAAGAVATDEAPDPYYSGGFEYVYQLVETGCTLLLERLRAEHALHAP